MTSSSLGSKVVLVTGATGFVGSALTANLLARGARVLAVSRENGASRTMRAVEAAAAGFGFVLSDPERSRLAVINADLASATRRLDDRVLGSITDVWHCAASMTYDLDALDDALQDNLVATTMLYRVIAERAPSCRHFYHVSTAYTAGVDGGDIKEELHFEPRLVNAYQISKWCAEQALVLLAERSRLDLTLFRPTIVVGHRVTGWSTRRAFGYYLFLNAAQRAARFGRPELTLNIDPDHRPNLVPVDDVVRAAVALTARSQPLGHVEVMHCTAEATLTTREQYDLAGEFFGVTVRWGEPRTRFDEIVNRELARNRDFAAGTWEFDCSTLRRAIGDRAMGQPVTADVMRTIVAAFAGHRVRERRTPSRSAEAVVSLHDPPAVRG
jgi:nucleoside-diphosphate-sugar epimerase